MPGTVQAETLTRSACEKSRVNNREGNAGIFMADGRAKKGKNSLWKLSLNTFSPECRKIIANIRLLRRFFRYELNLYSMMVISYRIGFSLAIIT